MDKKKIKKILYGISILTAFFEHNNLFNVVEPYLSYKS